MDSGGLDPAAKARRESAAAENRGASAPNRCQGFVERADPVGHAALDQLGRAEHPALAEVVDDVGLGGLAAQRHGRDEGASARFTRSCR
jgi:hypothetical protein